MTILDLLKNDHKEVSRMIEEQILYPALKNNPETSDIIEESYEEHAQVDEILKEMSPGGDDFEDQLEELRESVEHHVDEEENELFPKAKTVLGEARLQEMGKQMETMKQRNQAA